MGCAGTDGSSSTPFLQIIQWMTVEIRNQGKDQLHSHSANPSSCHPGQGGASGKDYWIEAPAREGTASGYGPSGLPHLMLLDSTLGRYKFHLCWSF